MTRRLFISDWSPLVAEFPIWAVQAGGQSPSLSFFLSFYFFKNRVGFDNYGLKGCSGDCSMLFFFLKNNYDLKGQPCIKLFIGASINLCQIYEEISQTP